MSEEQQQPEQPQAPGPGHGERLSRKQEQAISALLVAPTYLAAAQSVELNPKTLRRWAALPHFKAAYELARRELLGNTINRIQTASHSAIAALQQDLADESVGVRQAAASMILNCMHKSTELLTLSERVTALEAAIRTRRK
jgi:hypothetical protein